METTAPARSKILDLKAFVPAKDMEVSKRFYLDLGFHEVWGNEFTRVCPAVS
jgi:hypothetical protein